MSEMFRKFARKVSRWAGQPTVFIIACLIIVAWAISGPLFQFSDTWQLVINTSTTVITFLMVFLIQNTQSRDSMATHLKLDELIRSHKEARNKMIDLEEMSDRELDEIHREFCSLREHYTEKAEYIEQHLKRKRHGKT